MIMNNPHINQYFTVITFSYLVVLPSIVVVTWSRSDSAFKFISQNLHIQYQLFSFSLCYVAPYWTF